MARWALKFGGSPDPVVTGDDTADPNVIIIEDPIGTVVSTLSRAGNFAGVNVGAAKLTVGTPTAEADAASVTLDVTKTNHDIATDGANFSGAANFVASAAGTAGDILIVRVHNAASNGTTTVTFTTHFKPSATLAVLQATQATVVFLSDGTNFNEIFRSAIFAV